MKLIVGLGNPEPKYFRNLHNIGFMAVETLAENFCVDFNKKAFKGMIGEKNVSGEKIIFLKPQTYMNLSGESVKAVADFYKIATENILVFYDDLDLPIGSVRIRKKGSAGTHNGMRNIVQNLNSENFPRVRIGTKPAGGYRDIIDYVLSDIKKEDEPLFREAILRAVKAAEAFVNGVDMDKIMCDYNG